MIVLEEAHNLLLKKASDVFVDQSESLLSRVAFANSYTTIALSQKHRSDVQTIAGATNLTLNIMPPHDKRQISAEGAG